MLCVCERERSRQGRREKGKRELREKGQERRIKEEGVREKDRERKPGVYLATNLKS
jgi:hypothetical protein